MSALGQIGEFFAGVWTRISEKFSPTPPTNTVAVCPVGAMTQAQANKWFNRFRDDTTFPWNYPNDCCYTRAEVMAQQLEDEGYKPGKAWNYRPESGLLRVNTPNDPKGYVEWRYHVAPTVPVLQSDGSTQLMVFDPSIASGPITPQQWKDLQGRGNSTLVLTDASPYYRAPDGRVDPTPSHKGLMDQFQQHRLDRAENWSESGRPPP